MSSQDIIGVVVDAGSRSTKAGFSGESFPRCFIPTAVGRFREISLLDGIPELYFGKEAIKYRGISNTTYPIKNGMVDNWDEMEKIWHHIFYKELHVAPEGCKLLNAIHPLTKRRDKEKMAEILFESFIVHDLYLAQSSSLALYACGRTTGVVLENGHMTTYAAPVFEGFTLKNATECSKINGKVLTDYFQKLLSDVGYSFTTPADIDILEKMKAELCYVASDYNEEVTLKELHKDKLRYDLPDGQHVLIGDERFKCPELLFQPSLLEYNCPNIIDVICSSISKCDIDHRSLFYNNIIVSGGSSLFSGLTKRINFELIKRLVDIQDVKISIEAIPSRHTAPWVGGSIFSSVNVDKEIWVSKTEYDDAGIDRIYYKFY